MKSSKFCTELEEEGVADILMGEDKMAKAPRPGTSLTLSVLFYFSKILGYNSSSFEDSAHRGRGRSRFLARKTYVNLLEIPKRIDQDCCKSDFELQLWALNCMILVLKIS